MVSCLFLYKKRIFHFAVFFAGWHFCDIISEMSTLKLKFHDQADDVIYVLSNLDYFTHLQIQALSLVFQHVVAIYIRTTQRQQTRQIGDIVIPPPWYIWQLCSSINYVTSSFFASLSVDVSIPPSKRKMYSFSLLTMSTQRWHLIYVGIVRSISPQWNQYINLLPFFLSSIHLVARLTHFFFSSN